MRAFIAISCVLILALSLSAPADGEGEAGMMMGPKPEAEAFSHHVMFMSPYQGWGYWPGYGELVEGKSPHGAYIRLFGNAIALKAAREGADVMPDGSIIMKENYDKDKKLVALTPMYKSAGYNPEGGDWYWAKMSPDGKVMADGKLKGCIDCHAKVKKKDWIFLSPKK